MIFKNIKKIKKFDKNQIKNIFLQNTLFIITHLTKFIACLFNY